MEGAVFRGRYATEVAALNEEISKLEAHRQRLECTRVFMEKIQTKEAEFGKAREKEEADFEKARDEKDADFREKLKELQEELDVLRREVNFL